MTFICISQGTAVVLVGDPRRTADCFVGEVEGCKTLKIYMPISSDKLHGDGDSKYLSNWLGSLKKT